jgi:hypothetical protein
MGTIDLTDRQRNLLREAVLFWADAWGDTLAQGDDQELRDLAALLGIDLDEAHLFILLSNQIANNRTDAEHT